MDFDMYYTIAVILLAVFFFVTEYFTLDLVAIGIIVLLVVGGVISVEDGLSGFANSATLTVASMFVLSHALIRTQIIQSVAPYFARVLGKSYPKAILGLGLSVGSISSFINNTPVVAAFIPIISDAARKLGLSPGRFLIPLSYAAIFGGTCTLIGTSTNLLVDGIARDNGVEGFSMFLMAPLGLIFFAVGLLYLILFGKKLIPERGSESEIENRDEVRDYLLEVTVTGSAGSDLKLSKIQEITGHESMVLQVKNGDEYISDPHQDMEINTGDNLLLKGGMDEVKKLVKDDRFSLVKSKGDKSFPGEWTNLAEVVIRPNSELIDKRLDEVDFGEFYKSRVLAIRQRGKDLFEDFGKVRLRSGDIVLLQTNDDGFDYLRELQRENTSPFYLTRTGVIEKARKRSSIIVISTIFAAVILAAIGWVPIVIGALSGIIVLNVTGIITMRDAYNAIDWKVIFLLAGALSLGEAMKASGISQMIGDTLSDLAHSHFGPVLVVGILYLTTSVFTELMSNNAAAALLAPIAISVASTMQVDPIPLLLSITFAGSASFMTPVGYQTNTMVYSAGSYDFKDFLRTGGPLNLIFFVLATLLIPLIYPF